jgi:hypothetical protein
MHLINYYTGLLLFFSFSLFSQNQETSTTIYPSKSVFEKYQNDINFLNRCLLKIDSLQDDITNLFNNPIENQNYHLELNDINQSFQIFTDFNAKRLVVIDKNLSSTIPVKGSEITYLHKSFFVYKKYDKLYKLFQNKLNHINNSYKSSQFKHALLTIKLNRISFFYKNYYNVISNRRLRRILNAGDATFKLKDNELKKIAKKLFSKKNYLKIKKLSKNKPNWYSKDSSLLKHIQTFSYHKSRIKKDKKKIINYFWEDKSHKIAYFISHHVSGFIGNTAGLFRFRKGYLYNNDSIYNEILSRLKPMDIITEKTGFTLTDKMIPGYFGHIAIWLGTEQELKKSRLWDHPVIRPFHNRIRLGYNILETDRKGTHLKTLKKFINVDELAIAGIIRFSDLTMEQKTILYQNALAQLGKEYDFNFDVETSDKLVCSELLYQVFGSIHWPTDDILKRKTISPDNVLSLVLYNNSPIKLKYYVGAKDKTKIYSKNTDDLAKDLGFIKKNNNYSIKEKKCFINEKKKKQCKTIYHILNYQ